MFLRKKKYGQLSDEELMKYSRNGDEAAFAAIYDRYASPLFGYFCRMLKHDREKAEDFVQDLFSKIIHQPGSYDPNRPFKTWLYSIANNMCKNEYRSIAVRQKAGDYLSNGSELRTAQNSRVENQHDDAVFREALQSALNELDDKQRSAFVMRYEEELSIKEIAAVFECSEGTVKSRLFYTLRKLNERLHAFNPHKSTP